MRSMSIFFHEENSRLSAYTVCILTEYIYPLLMESWGICASHRGTLGEGFPRQNSPVAVLAPLLRFSIVWISPTAVGDQRRRLWNPQAFKKA